MHWWILSFVNGSFMTTYCINRLLRGLLQLSQSLSSSSCDTGRMCMFLAWLSSVKRSVVKEIRLLIEWGGVYSFEGSTCPHRDKHFKGAKDLGRKVNSGASQKPTEGIFASHRLDKLEEVNILTKEGITHRKDCKWGFRPLFSTVTRDGRAFDLQTN